ncbi:MAG: hypothetical protein IPK22_05290 [Verrucomicrobiaceae bacterium]|nr:hypothetical protein [Verrucomicrobiaceae bacterium]
MTHFLPTALEGLLHASGEQIVSLLELVFTERPSETAQQDAQKLLGFAQDLVKRYEVEKPSKSVEWPSVESIGLETKSRIEKLFRLLPDEKDKADNSAKRFLLAAGHHYCQTNLSWEERTIWRTRAINAILNEYDMAIGNVTWGIKPLLDQKLIRVLPGQEAEKAEGKQLRHEILPAGLRRASEIATELDNLSNTKHNLPAPE